MNRRTLLLAPLALAGCTPGAPGQPSAAQVIADAQAVVTGLDNMQTALKPLLAPAMAAQIAQAIGIAKGLVATLSAAVPDGTNALTLAQIVNIASGVLAVVSALPGLPPNIAIAAAAASALLPILVAFVTPLLPAQAPALVAKTATPAAAAMTPDQARAVLKAKP